MIGFFLMTDLGLTFICFSCNKIGEAPQPRKKISSKGKYLRDIQLMAN